MKVSNAISAKATAAGQSTGRSSARQPSPTSADWFALGGPSSPPDPAKHAYRRDLADIALAGRVIASHFARPVERVIATTTALVGGPSDGAEVVRTLDSGESFLMLEDSVGWAWGYAGGDRRVGYVRSEALVKG